MRCPSWQGWTTRSPAPAQTEHAPRASSASSDSIVGFDSPDDGVLSDEVILRRFFAVDF
jgi:hypothetical protein